LKAYSLCTRALGIYIAIKEMLKLETTGKWPAAAVIGVEARRRAERKYIFIIESSTLQCVYSRNLAEG
jgi:hypothetical protein